VNGRSKLRPYMVSGHKKGAPVEARLEILP
jgi:hypothetical protein